MTFFDADLAAKTAQQALLGMDDGELFVESLRSESFALDDGVLRTASFNTSTGFGLRAIMGETVAYAHSSNFDQSAFQQAAEVVKAVKSGHAGAQAIATNRQSTPLYIDNDPLLSAETPVKIELLQQMDAYARDLDKRVVQVMASLSGEHQKVYIYRGNGQNYSDIRPLVRLNISVVVEENGPNGKRRESGGTGMGGRYDYSALLQQETWQSQVKEALRLALVNLEAVDAPAGEMPVVLGNGWTGVLLHEAVGHGLEGDFNRKKTSTFSDRIGEQVASKGVTVVDDGTIPNRRGSISIDDEGVAPNYNILIEDGILKGYIQDRLNARLMGVAPTGNGRRESYAHTPMPRMTNTYMLNGSHTREEMIESVQNGIYAANFGGGQVDITSGQFVFSASEAYKIENGKITTPIKGATLIGNGPKAMQKISMIGNDMALDRGVGTCGKDGQSVPVGVGQPSIKIEGITVGGTAV